MASGMPIVLGLSIRMSDPCAYAVFGAPTLGCWICAWGIKAEGPNTILDGDPRLSSEKHAPAENAAEGKRLQCVGSLYRLGGQTTPDP